MSPRLEDCSNELIECIVTQLDLRDICNLRLSSRTLAAKTARDHFKSYFCSKHVDITDSALRAFIVNTRRGELGCLVRDLVLVGVVHNTKLLESILREKDDGYWAEDEGEEVDKGENDEDDEIEEGDEDDDDDDEEEEEEAKPEEQIKAEQDLKILTEQRSDYEQMYESEAGVRLLSEAFSNILANSATGRLRSLSLKVVVYREDAVKRIPPLAGGSSRYIWKSAADAFHIALSSLEASSLPIERLNIFNDRHLQRCSLASDALGRVDFGRRGLATSLAPLKSLSLSFSEKIVFTSQKDAWQSHDPAEDTDWPEAGSGRDEESIKAEMADESNFVGLAKLLQLSAQLEDLALHQYWLGRDGRALDDLHLERLFQRAAEMDTPPTLKRLELRGLFTREEELSAFIQRTGVRSLSMHNVYMFSGTFRSIFDYCTSNDASMEKLYFDELYERGLFVYFDQPGNFRFAALSGPGGSDALEREGPAVKQQISYYCAGRVMIGSPETAQYKKSRYREYGPPTLGSA